MREIGDISKQMLSRTLKQLEQDGFITRTLYPEVPPRVEYSLTPLGHSFLEPMQQLVDWADTHHHASWPLAPDIVHASIAVMPGPISDNAGPDEGSSSVQTPSRLPTASRLARSRCWPASSRSRPSRISSRRSAWAK